jgi:HD-GYP domain-containing protein (c-di-GMP phosphodiesterase class II)
MFFSAAGMAARPLVEVVILVGEAAYSRQSADDESKGPPPDPGQVCKAARVEPDHERGIRVAELLVGLSSVADLGMGQPVGSAARSCLVAVWLSRASGCHEDVVSDVLYAALLQHIGCTAYSHEASMLFADELSIKRASLETDFSSRREVVLGYLPTVVREAPARQRLRTGRSALLHSRSLTDGYSLANCEVASVVARRLGFPDGVQRGLLEIFEWWSGEGRPNRLRGEDISLVARIVNVAGVIALFDRLGGSEAARNAVQQRAGRSLDPAIVDVFRRGWKDALAPLDAIDPSDVLLGAEPRPVRMTSEAQVGEILRTFGEAVDLKAPFLHGHATEVARLTRAAAEVLRLAPAEVRDAEHAAYVHDLGRAAVPSSIWERAGSLGSDAWPQVRLHAYYSEHILARSTPLAALAPLAGMHHERLDGSGYHRSAHAAQIPMTARVLAAADAYQALTSERPHRRGNPPAKAVDELRTMAWARRLDPDAVDAVVVAAGGGRPARSHAGRAGLTERQIEVLALVANGLSNRAIAKRLTISPRTAEHHVQDVYARIGVSSRAAAAMYAMEHGLLPQDA